MTSLIRSLRDQDRALWRRLTTPLAVDPDEAFREKTLRILVLIHVFIALAMPVYTLVRFGRWHWLHPGVMLLLLAGSVVCIRRRRLELGAGLLLASAYWVGFGSFVTNGIWALSFSSTHSFLTLGGILILPPRIARWLPYLAVLLYAVTLLLQLAVHAPGVTVTSIPDAIGSIGTIIVSNLIAWKGITYLMNEFRQQRVQLMTLVNTLEDRVRARTNDLEAAVEVSRDVASELTMDAVMQNIANVTRVAYRLSGVVIFTYDADQSALLYAFGSGETYPYEPDTSRIALNHETCDVALVARERQPLIMHGASQASRKSALTLPLLTRMGEVLGVFVLISDQPDYFVPDKVRVFTLLANHLAGSMRNAQLYAAQLQANERLKTLDNMKSQFLTNISHELKTPLNISLNFVEFVMEGIYGPVNEEQRDALVKAHANGHQLLELINALLDLSRIEAGLTLHFEPYVNLNAELADMRLKVASLLKDKPVQFVEDIDPDLPRITCDRRGVRHILLNLLSNAAKFTAAGTITLSVKQVTNGVLIAVIDTGPGIAPEDQPAIFDPFKQARAGQVHGGSGLGLAIARSLVEAHGGQISVRSEPGQGAEFYVTLPNHPPVEMALTET